MDHELAADLAGTAGGNRGYNFVFIDACFSGGLIEELLDALPNVVGTTTCTRKGYGYDDAATGASILVGGTLAPTKSGAWTNAFLLSALMFRQRENLDPAVPWGWVTAGV